MKKLFTNLFLGLSFGSFIFLASCSETDPLPISVADFKVTSIGPEIDVPVQFENLSLNAAAYTWDYGDGNIDSLVINPTHTYEDPGSYTVTMSAYTEDGQKSVAMHDVEVGQRYLTAMWLLNINMLDENGDPWDDDGSGPDVLYQLGPTDAESLDDLVFVYIDSLNVGQFRTPIVISDQDLIPADYELLDKDYFVLLEDIDTVNNEPDFVFMASVEFNPVNPVDDFITVSKRDDGSGNIIGDIAIPFVVIDEYQFYLEFEIR